MKADDDGLEDQKRQIYMLKGQLYEQQHRAELAEIAKQKNGLFLGGILGSMTVDSLSYADVHPFVAGVKVGYQKYLNYIAGLRFYGEYIGGSDFEEMIYQLGSVNLDLIADIPLDSDQRYSIGFFAGVGMGWTYYSDSVTKPALEHFGPVVNVGIAVTLDLRSRIELEMKIPPLKINDSQKFKFSSTNLYFVSYNFLF
ncbi:outer membrane beta-barrel protein [Helicobacter cappadocius]|uniref:Outer membrane beta-barrel protein n=1 Tax=Helicobacter cappadocius TaxID=3063998 RepID=A0AA90T5C5_9HELI|nr:MULTISPECIES: outer membrane beta-barrel protein [unclassified Helicobacter]MDO7253297.1 outer membrane beta-barrel protein [Helicobacter sp. faydin-H75]MDP2539273.1 outer membrane beta-barrel protein [Helicobacter sp. faydin-H76]